MPSGTRIRHIVNIEALEHCALEFLAPYLNEATTRQSLLMLQSDLENHIQLKIQSVACEQYDPCIRSLIQLRFYFEDLTGVNAADAGQQWSELHPPRSRRPLGRRSDL